METISERITVDPDICNGKPTIRGKRITVQTVIEFLASVDSIDDILDSTRRSSAKTSTHAFASPVQ